MVPMIDWLILTACHSVSDYFTSWGIIFVVCLYLHFLYSCSLIVFFAHGPIWMNSKQNYLTHKWDPNKVNLGVMAIKKYSTLPRSLEFKLHHQMQDTLFWVRSYPSAGYTVSKSGFIDVISTFVTPSMFS